MAKLNDLESRWNNVLDRIERLRKERDQAQGAYDSAIQALKDEFECTSLVEARQKLNEFEAERENLEQQLAENLRTIEGKLNEIQTKVE